MTIEKMVQDKSKEQQAAAAKKLTFILTRASRPGAKAWTKEQARAGLLSIMIEDRAPTEEEWINIYQHFADTRGIAKAKSPIEWLSKHRANKDEWSHLSYLYSDGKRLIATDGHRLALLPTVLAPGFYDDDLNKLDVDHTYPNIDRVIPVITRSHATVTIALADVQNMNRKRGQGRVGDQIEIVPGIWVQYSYLRDALSCTKEKIFSLMYNTEDVNATLSLQFKDMDLHLSIIMPVRQ